jgi:hypothetical protein
MSFKDFFLKAMGDFIQANVETSVKQNEELRKRAIPGVTKYLSALIPFSRTGSYFIFLKCERFYPSECRDECKAKRRAKQKSYTRRS